MTGLEPATSGVTGRCSNQLSYIPKTYQLTTCDNISTTAVSIIRTVYRPFKFDTLSNLSADGKNCIQQSRRGSSPVLRVFGHR
jgi:hypothetical protein